jgi:uncharacterized protein (DUF305 family)
MMDMPGMMTIERMDALAIATGPDFDRQWLEMMITHHEGAILQAEQVLAAGADPEVKTLAEQIVSGQGAEIDEMNGLLAG